MALKNETTKGAKQTTENQAHPTHHIRDDLTDDESNGFVEKYPITELMEPGSRLPKGQNINAQMKNPSQSLPHSSPQSKERGVSESSPKVDEEGEKKFSKRIKNVASDSDLGIKVSPFGSEDVEGREEEELSHSAPVEIPPFP